MVFSIALRSALVLTLLASVTICAAAARDCWYPDGATESPDLACDPNAEESACCGPDAFCLSNGLCMRSGVVSRGSCTDRSWNDPACAQECVGDNPTGGAVLINCNVTLGTWVCAVNGDSCGDDADLITVNSFALNRIALRPQDDSSSPLLITPNSSITNSSDGENGTSVITVTASPTATATDSSDAQFTTGQMAGVGAGVGVPLLLALLGALFVIVRQRRRLRAAEAYGKEHELKPTAVHGRQGQPMPYESYGLDPHKGQDAAPYYRPISPQPPAGHFREMEPVMELDSAGQRAELGPAK